MTRKLLPGWLPVLALLVVGCATVPNAAPGRYYSRKPFGSEAQFNPVSEIVNEGFDMLRTEHADRHVLDFPYDIAFGNVARSMLHPDAAYRRFGWGRAVRGELLPLTTRSGGGGQWFPNYQFHLLGGGMISARMTEWYAQHGVPYPSVFSGATMAAAHLLNEAIENGSSRDPNEDAVTDLYFFDLGGILLFRSTRVQRLFSEKLELTNWPGQASFDFHRRTIENAGQQYALRVPLPKTKRVRLFYAFGVSTLGGLSFGTPHGTVLSLGGGVDAVDNPEIDPKTGARTVTFKPNGGLFLDRGGSLLVSVTRTSLSDASVAANVYPGIVRIGGFSPGLWAQLLRGGGVRVGLAGPLGLGVARARGVE